jgi:hypothetical protein
MTIIYKYEIPITDYFCLDLPLGASFLSIQLQNGKPVIWYLVDRHAAMKYEHFCVVGTGIELPSWYGIRLQYLDTIQIESFVWHIFQKHVVDN